MNNKISWKNIKSYDHKTIIGRIAFVKKNMVGLLPLGTELGEIKGLQKYAKDHKLPIYEMICFRSAIKIQQEIYIGKYISSNMDKFKKLYNKKIDKISVDKNELMTFLIQNNLPVSYVYKLLDKKSEIKNISQQNISILKTIINNNEIANKEIIRRSKEFEISLEKYIDTFQISYRTEEDIRIDKDYVLTPDILFDTPITLIVNNVEYKIRWMDAKNYTLFNVQFIMKSLNKQASKYYNVFGQGAFVFHYGFDNSITIPNVVILDGSFLNPV